LIIERFKLSPRLVVRRQRQIAQRAGGSTAATVNVDDSFGKGFGGFLQHIVLDAALDDRVELAIYWEVVTNTFLRC
jgi:hypothetical protein